MAFLSRQVRCVALHPGRPSSPCWVPLHSAILGCPSGWFFCFTLRSSSLFCSRFSFTHRCAASQSPPPRPEPSDKSFTCFVGPVSIPNSCIFQAPFPPFLLAYFSEDLKPAYLGCLWDAFSPALGCPSATTNQFAVERSGLNLRRPQAQTCPSGFFRPDLDSVVLFPR